MTMAEPPLGPMFEETPMADNVDSKIATRHDQHEHASLVADHSNLCFLSGIFERRFQTPVCIITPLPRRMGFHHLIDQLGKRWVICSPAP